MEEKKVKLKLEELRVESFITALDKTEKETVNGGDSSYPCYASYATSVVVSQAIVSESVKATVSYSGTTTGASVAASTGTATLGQTVTATSVASTASAAVGTVVAFSAGYSLGTALNYGADTVATYVSLDESGLLYTTAQSAYYASQAVSQSMANASNAASNALSYLGGCSYWPMC